MNYIIAYNSFNGGYLC
ncbi:unnamed protein product [Lasius platythorax]|uniref:Uncharacterized protein n=1 Tax=Lasius platythorax TaxID=488582 RepID=A0AAV2N3U7_9HYME